MQRAAAVARACPLRVPTADRRASASRPTPAPNVHRRPRRSGSSIPFRASAEVAASSVTFEEESPEADAMPSRAPGDDRPSPQGYYRWPALHGDVLVFVCEDDLWRCDVAGGVATRITDAPGPVLAPLVSRDGCTVSRFNAWLVRDMNREAAEEARQQATSLRARHAESTGAYVERRRLREECFDDASASAQASRARCDASEASDCCWWSATTKPRQAPRFPLLEPPDNVPRGSQTSPSNVTHLAFTPESNATARATCV